MRMSKDRIKLMAVTLTDKLQEQGLLELHGSKGTLIQALVRVITEELSVEDRLNAEIREILKQFEGEFEKGRADYQKMFTMVKSKLVRERGLVL